jgi:hypothetical protein
MTTRIQHLLQPLDAPADEMLGTLGERDAAYWDSFDRIATAHPHSLLHTLTHWPVYARRISLQRFLAHYELYKMAAALPGSIVECGVSRGSSLLTWHKLIEIFNPTDTFRRVYGFDSFEGLTDFREQDGDLDIGNAAKRNGGWSAAKQEEELFELVRLANADSILARERTQLIKGRVQDSLPGFLDANPGLRICILNLDMDIYEPTRFALDHLYERVVPGGIVILDEYGIPPWEGEARAVEDFFGKGNVPKIRKLEFCQYVGGYFIKE